MSGSSGTHGPTVHMPTWLRSGHLAVVPILAGATDEALVAPLAPWALGLGEGLLEGMLFGVHLIIEELSCQLRPIANLNLHGARQWSGGVPDTHPPGSAPLPGHPLDLSHTPALESSPRSPPECHPQEHRVGACCPAHLGDPLPASQTQGEESHGWVSLGLVHATSQLAPPV